MSSDRLIFFDAMYMAFTNTSYVLFVVEPIKCLSTETVMVTTDDLLRQCQRELIVPSALTYNRTSRNNARLQTR